MLRSTLENFEKRNLHKNNMVNYMYIEIIKPGT